jgi:chromatin segregation and condensation protein Rec8/ScpA/Scc1 (kleisin family)
VPALRDHVSNEVLKSLFTFREREVDCEQKKSVDDIRVRDKAVESESSSRFEKCVWDIRDERGE